MVSDRLELVGRHPRVVNEHSVVRRATRAEQRSVRLRVPVELERRDDVRVDGRAGLDVTVLGVGVPGVLGEHRDVVTLSRNDEGEFGLVVGRNSLARESDCVHLCMTVSSARRETRRRTDLEDLGELALANAVSVE